MQPLIQLVCTGFRPAKALLPVDAKLFIDLFPVYTHMECPGTRLIRRIIAVTNPKLIGACRLDFNHGFRGLADTTIRLAGNACIAACHKIAC
ncbi:hypothetical protein D3C73_491990 [compost metagenome]